jgi:hypothetical protein
LKWWGDLGSLKAFVFAIWPRWQVEFPRCHAVPKIFENHKLLLGTGIRDPHFLMEFLAIYKGIE